MAPPLSVVFANKDDESLVIVEGDKWSESVLPPSKFEPIGIVVIPGTHGILKDSNGKNQCGIMSLVGMNYNTPETGGGESELDKGNRMDWGITRSKNPKPDGMKSYSQVVSVPNNLSNTSYKLSDLRYGYAGGYAYFKIQSGVGKIPYYDSYSSSPWCPTPYNGEDYKSGSYNESYGTTIYDTEDKRNALSDFDGRGNTNKTLEKRGIRDYSSWKPYDIQDDYPAASCCDMFHTLGTKQGDWYLPAIGELGYIPPKICDINDVINRLKMVYGIGLPLGTDSVFFYLSSTIKDFLPVSSDFEMDLYSVRMSDGGLYNDSHGSGYNQVRAFMRL